MLKAPRPGTVKTRLARDVGDAEAARIYRDLVAMQCAAVPEKWRVEVHFTPADAEDEMRAWLAETLPRDAGFFAQADGDLGARLGTALQSAFERGAGRVIFAGGDCPALTRARLLEAAEAIASDEDAAIIPALDGGYVLIGLGRDCASVFQNIAWSTSAVFKQTLDRIRAAGLRERVLLPALEDVDDLESWGRHEQACISTPA